ncbi:phage tail tape measure protein [Streptomyces sp. NPDC046853]|uniref:phage tail tape measure protein n=1 Tax=Streptomyces sp. NPDC046853 TaxID=3154920 RepID=UPI0033E8E160
MPTVGYATLQIIPSVRGISDELRRQLVGPAGDAGGQAGTEAGNGLKDKLKGGAIAAGAAAGALLVAGIGEAMEQANITNSLQASLGTTGKVAAAQGKVAGKLYSTGVSGSFQEAADAIKAVVQSGLAPPDATNAQLQAIATKASDVANVFGQDMGGVTNAVSQMMKTGLAKNSTEAFDIITKGFQSGADKGGDLLDTVNEYGVQFQKAGLTGADAMGLINQAIKAGARDSDVAADAIKEFSIRAVDGSKSTVSGFKALGLSADDMAAKFGKGGKTSKAALDLTLDRLRGIKDPVKQAQVATALFGTQAEDLGQALFAMDPSSAAKDLGKFGGAADKVGKTIRSGPSHEITVFTRALKQGFVDFIGGQVLPILGTLARGFTTYLLPPIRSVASVVAASLVPALQGIWQGGAAVVNWLQDMGTWLIPIGIAIGGLTLAMTANAIATGAMTAVFATYRAVMLVGIAVTNGMTIAQGLLAAVMRANPIILIVTAIIALGAALVVAYQRSETFRGIVQAVWAGIQTAVMTAWTAVIKPALDGFMTGLRAVGSAASWLWTTILQPVFSGIATGAKILATIITILVAGPIIVALKLIGAAGSWLWKVAIGPAFRGIASLGKWMWFNVLQPTFGLVRSGMRAMGNAATWLYRNAIQPAFNGSVAAGRLLLSGLRSAFSAIRQYIVGPLGSAFRYLRDNVVKPVMSGIRTTISSVYNNGIKPVFNALKSATGQVAKAFDTARRGIKTAWDKVKSIAKAPVKFVIDTVYNGGIVKVWNKVAGAFGAPTLDPIKGFARGGILPGYTPGRDPHKFYSPTGGALEMSGGEAIMRPEFTRAVGAGFVGTMNRIARTRGATGVQKALAPTMGGNPQRFADGGIFGWIGKGANAVAGVGSAAWDKVKAGAKWLADTLEASARAGVKHVVDPLLAKFPGMDTKIGRMIRRIPTKIIDSLFGFSKEADKKGAGGSLTGGPRVQRALKWARSQNGKRYQWGGNGNPSWDCSGFMGAIESVLRGQKPHRRWTTFGFHGAFAPPGWAKNAKSPFRIGVTNAGVGHTAGTLGGVNVESRGGDGVIVGKRARGYNSGLFNSRYGFTPAKKYDTGGWLQPGLTATVNATGQPEAVLTASQWRVAAGALAGGREPVVVEVHTRDQALADFIDVRVHQGQRELVSVIRSS